MSRQLVFVHGRAQENKDGGALKAEWLEALGEGLRGSGRVLPITAPDVRFPFYGDTLYQMVGGRSAGEAAEVVLRGDIGDAEERRFSREVIEEVRKHAGVTDEQIAEVAGEEVIERGPQNWEFTQAVLRAIDRYVPFGSGASISLFTHDVFQYLRNSSIREAIESGVSAALTAEAETVVVAHSLGSVIAYNLLRREGHLRGWKVPLLVTLGSPLAISAIRRSLRNFAPTRCPECVSAWYNAMDERDVVALYPLDATHFPLAPAEPAIENKRDVRNRTTNRHGIVGYLEDPQVALQIYDALMA